MEFKMCPKCRRRDTADYCTQCGVKMVDVPRCSCGEIILASYKYCAKCGKPVNKE